MAKIYVLIFIKIMLFVSVLNGLLAVPAQPLLSFFYSSFSFLDGLWRFSNFGHRWTSGKLKILQNQTQCSQLQLHLGSGKNRVKGRVTAVAGKCIIFHLKIGRNGCWCGGKGQTYKNHLA